MSDVVELSIPVQADLVILARLAATTVASRAGFDVEEVEDLRLAVDELCLLTMGGNHQGRLLVTFATDPDQIEISCSLLPSSDHADPEFTEHSSDDLSLRILEALVDEYGDDTRGGMRRTWLRKRRTRQKA